MKLKSLLICLFIAIPIPTSVSAQVEDDAPQISSDTTYYQSISRLYQLLQARGYQIKSIKPTWHKGRTILQVEAMKNGQTYDIRLTYPSLKIISEKRDD